jgi:uncharacterized protein (DUF58 family)
VHNRKRYFPSFSLSILDKSRAWEGGIGPEGYLLKVPAGGAAEVMCRGMISKRGLHSMDKVLFRTEYPFGLFIKETDYRCNQKLLVYPALGSILDRTILQPSRGRSSSLRPDKTVHELEEFHSLREYRRGDNPKWIHWRSSARMNRLMLREFETRTGKEAFIYLDLCSSNGDGHGIEAAVEQAIGFTATLVNELHRRGYAVTLAGEGLRPSLQSSYPGENGVAHLFRSLALGEVVRGRFQIPNGEQERMLSRPGYKVLVSAGGDDNEALSRLGEGLRIIRVSHPSFYSLYSPPALEADSK